MSKIKLIFLETIPRLFLCLIVTFCFITIIGQEGLEPNILFYGVLLFWIGWSINPLLTKKVVS